MKYSLLIYAAVLQILIGIAVLKPMTFIHWRDALFRADSQMNFFRRQTRGVLSRLATQVPPGALYVIGDSHVQGMQVSQISPDAVNLGIGGDRVRDVLARLADYAGLATARRVIVLVGLNDLNRGSGDSAATGVAKILAALRAPVFLVAIPPVDERHTATRNADILALNRNLRAACVAACTFIDVTPELAGSDGQLGYHVGDGIHLNAGGYAILTKALTGALAAAETPPPS